MKLPVARVVAIGSLRGSRARLRCRARAVLHPLPLQPATPRRPPRSRLSAVGDTILGNTPSLPS